jgi:hypothetical protein
MARETSEKVSMANLTSSHLMEPPDQKLRRLRISPRLEVMKPGALSCRLHCMRKISYFIMNSFDYWQHPKIGCYAIPCFFPKHIGIAALSLHGKHIVLAHC